MNDDAFARLVAEEVKNRVSKTQRDFLKMVDQWPRWQRALIALDKNLDGQLERIGQDEKDDRSRYEALGDDGIRLLAEAMSEYEARRSRIARFKFHVEKRLDEVSAMIARGVDAMDDDLGTFLTKAITKHRDMLRDYDLEATPIDQALWNALEGKWTFDSINPEDV